jgi:tetratricopeptide (TPR) repeat protein
MSRNISAFSSVLIAKMIFLIRPAATSTVATNTTRRATPTAPSPTSPGDQPQSRRGQGLPQSRRRYENADKHDRLLPTFTKAIELDPKLSVALPAAPHASCRKEKAMKRLCCLVLAVAFGGTSAHAECGAGYEQSIRPFNEYHAQAKILLAQMDAILAPIKKNRTTGAADDDLQKLAHIQELLCTNVGLKLALVPHILSITTGCSDLRSQRASVIKERDKLENLKNIVCKKPALPASADTARDKCNQREDLDLTIQGCTAVLKQNPSNEIAAAAYNNRGIAYDDKGDHDRAMADYNQAISLDPKDASHYFNRGNAYQDKDDDQHAIADYTKAIALDPKLARAYVKRGISYENADKHDEAIADLTKAIELAPKEATIYLARANAYDGKDDYDRSIADYNKAIELNPEDPVIFRFRGDVYKEKHDYERAVADYTKAIELDPKQAKSYFGRGDAYDELRKYDEAIADYNKSIALDPGVAKVYNYRGVTYKNKRDYDRAIADFTKAITLDSTQALFFVNRGDAYSSKKDYSRAIADYTKAIELDPKHKKAYNGRAYSYSESGNYDRAIADYSKTVELDPEQAGPYNSRAWTYFKAGKAAQELPDVAHALELRPNDANALDTRGNIFETMGRKDEAIADYRKALSINPDMKGSAEGLTRLGAAPANTDQNNSRVDLSPRPAVVKQGNAEAPLPAPDQSTNPRPGSNAPPALQPVHLIEEDPSNPKEYLGQVVWRSVQARGDSYGQKDIAIRGDIEVPDLKFKMSFIISRNHDSSVPASHLAELTFILPPDFSGGGVEKVPGILMKSNEQLREVPLAGIAVKVTDGFFLVGLSNVDADRNRNVQLLKERAWFYIPLVYANNNRATVAIPKNEAGDRTFKDVFGAWERTAGEDAKVDTKADTAKSALTAQPFLGVEPKTVKTKTIHGDR